MRCASRYVRPPGAGVPVPLAYAGSMTSTSKLTRREKEVLGLLAAGGDNDAISQRLVISPETARTHIQNVLAKLGVHSRLEAAAFVVQNGLQDELIGAAT